MRPSKFPKKLSYRPHEDSVHRANQNLENARFILRALEKEYGPSDNLTIRLQKYFKKTRELYLLLKKA